MSWDYAELSKAAKEFGGPEKLVEAIEQNGRLEGQSSMVPVIAGAAIISSLATYVVIKIKNHNKSKRKESKEKADNAKLELIQRIESYDAEHMEKEEDNSEETR